MELQLAQSVTTDNVDFFKDFDLCDYVRPHHKKWNFSQEALELFHKPITYHNREGNEGPKHYGLKQMVHDYIYDNYYLNGDCKFLVTTELEQKDTPFKSYMDGKQSLHYTLDVCIIRVKDRKVFCVEIDGREHGRLKDKIRDSWLKDRYDIDTYRIDENDETINYGRLNRFIGA